MVSEVLSKMIRKTEVQYILGFLVSYGGCSVSYLQFANDIMIFCDVDVRQIRFLRCILRCFEAVLGFNTNLSKSELFQVGDVPNLESLT